MGAGLLPEILAALLDAHSSLLRTQLKLEQLHPDSSVNECLCVSRIFLWLNTRDRNYSHLAKAASARLSLLWLGRAYWTRACYASDEVVTEWSGFRSDPEFGEEGGKKEIFPNWNKEERTNSQRCIFKSFKQEGRLVKLKVLLNHLFLFCYWLRFFCCFLLSEKRTLITSAFSFRGKSTLKRNTKTIMMA